MASEELDLEGWISRVRSAVSVQEVFAVLEEFRERSWSDVDCSEMSKAYMRVLDTLAAAPVSQSKGSAPQGDLEGPVWYEKL
jgi:hypothetical protein